jgi:hypothetical protein
MSGLALNLGGAALCSSVQHGTAITVADLREDKLDADYSRLSRMHVNAINSSVFDGVFRVVTHDDVVFIDGVRNSFIGRAIFDSLASEFGFSLSNRGVGCVGDEGGLLAFGKGSKWQSTIVDTVSTKLKHFVAAAMAAHLPAREHYELAAWTAASRRIDASANEMADEPVIVSATGGIPKYAREAAIKSIMIVTGVIADRMPIGASKAVIDYVASILTPVRGIPPSVRTRTSPVPGWDAPIQVGPLPPGVEPPPAAASSATGTATAASLTASRSLAAALSAPAMGGAGGGGGGGGYRARSAAYYGTDPYAPPPTSAMWPHAPYGAPPYGPGGPFPPPPYASPRYGGMPHGPPAAFSAPPRLPAYGGAGGRAAARSGGKSRPWVSLAPDNAAFKFGKTGCAIHGPDAGHPSAACGALLAGKFKDLVPVAPMEGESVNDAKARGHK